MPRPTKVALEEGFIKSCWAELAEIEDEHRRVCIITIVPTARKGVMHVQVSATALQSDENGVIRNDKIGQTYPNSVSVSFAGFLWDLSRRLCDQVTSLEEDLKRARK